MQTAEGALGLKSNERLDLGDYIPAIAYLKANQLFWECLQVARVEDREVIEDMILKAPDDSE